MPENKRIPLLVLFGIVLAAGSPFAAAQSKGKIVCWKDKAGKVVGCGDTVPPEYQQSATKEMDRTGVTRGTKESAEETAKRMAAEKEQAAKKSEEAKRLAEQKRQDTALINTYSNEKEIDQRRDRDLQVVEQQIAQLKNSLKNATDREREAKARNDAAAKGGTVVSAAMKEDSARANADVKKAEQNIAAKQKEQDEIRQRYAEQKKRYLELKGGAPAAATPAPAATTAAAPAAKPAAATAPAPAAAAKK